MMVCNQVDMKGFYVIYNERIYKCLRADLEFAEFKESSETGIARPKIILATCLDTDNELIMLRDEVFMFRFIRDRRGASE